MTTDTPHRWAIWAVLPSDGYLQEEKPLAEGDDPEDQCPGFPTWTEDEEGDR